METNLIGYYQIDCEILIAVSDCKQIKMIPMIKSVLDENDLVLKFLIQPIIIFLFSCYLYSGEFNLLSEPNWCFLTPPF
jgi:hypothetical protein